MNKKMLIGVGLFLLLAAGGIVYLASQSDADMRATKHATTPSSSESESLEKAETSLTPGVYATYSEEAFAKAEGQRVLFFHAAWCPQCRSIEADINKDGVPPGFTILKVDYDSNQALRQRYGITLQTTFVKVDGLGDQQGKYVAYDMPTFDAVKENFLGL